VRGMDVAVGAHMSLAMALESADFSDFYPVATSTLGAFQLLDRLGTGGMASIFKAQDIRTGELVALKTVRNRNEREANCLLREIGVLKGLDHPGVVRFRGAGTWNELPWMAMELLEGRTLFDEISAIWCRSAARELADDLAVSAGAGWMQRLQEEAQLAWPARPAAGGRLRDTASMLVRLARVVGYLHDQGVVHRDLKPENVFVGTDGRVTLLDFGLAARIRGRGAEGTPPRTTAVATTVEYAAPELLRGERLDERVDVYALGCIFYEAITGMRPFEASSIDDIVRMHLDEVPVCPSDVVSGLSWRLEDLILSMMSKRTKQRPRNGGEVAERLVEALGREADDSRPVA